MEMIASFSKINFTISSRFSSRLKSRWQEFKQQAGKMSTCNLTLLSTLQESKLRKVQLLLITTSTSNKPTTGWVTAKGCMAMI